MNTTPEEMLLMACAFSKRARTGYYVAVYIKVFSQKGDKYSRAPFAW